MIKVKTGDFVVVKDDPRRGIILTVSTFVPYEGSYARVLLGSETRVINTSLLTKVE